MIFIFNKNVFTIEKHTWKEKKFFKDSLFIEDKNYSIILNGVVLNKQSLLNGTQENWKDFVLRNIIEKGIDWIHLIEGSFWGIIVNKSTKSVIVYGDKIQSKPVYYFEDNDYLIVADNYYELSSCLRLNYKRLSLNIESCYLMLTYGYTFESKTLFNEIKRLLIGHYLELKSKKSKLVRFFQFRYEINSQISDSDAIELMDFLFKAAIKNSFEKDLEYNFNHLVGLSGGLDSRMTTIAAHELGYINQTNFTFSQSNYLDETIAKKIATDLKHEWIFKALDNGTFLKNVDEITRLSGGNVLFYGLAHSNSIYKLLNFENFGILHTGQLGDVIFSSFTKNSNVQNYAMGDGAYSKLLIQKIKSIRLEQEYENEEIFKLYIRGFYGANQGLLAAQKYTETYSPFYSPETISKLLTIPLEQRFNHRLYIKWINTKYPMASRYKWEKINTTINNPFKLKFGNKNLYVKNLLRMSMEKLKIKRSGHNSLQNMNPLGYWYNSNKELKKFLDDYIEQNINILEPYKELKKDCLLMYENGSPTEKNQVVSLLSGIRSQLD